MDIYDLLLAPIYAAIILMLGHKFSRKMRQKNPIYRYFLPGLAIKLLGAIMLGVVYMYYYKGGDTINYFNTAKTLAELLFDRPRDFMHLYFGSPSISEFYLTNSQFEFIYWVNDSYAYFVSKLFVPIVIVSLYSYACTAVVVAAICYIGVWRLFLLFVNEFPSLASQFRWSILFVPSVVFWGSGIMKDSITFSATCIYAHGFYWFFAQKKRKVGYLVSLLFGSILLVLIKPYILFALLPGSFLWFVALRMAKMKSVFLKVMFAPTLLAVGITGGLFTLDLIGDYLGKYSLEKVVFTASNAQQDLKQSYYKGNSFDIGSYEPTVAGLLSVSHKAIFAALFRPTFLDVRNVVMGLNAIENSFVLIFCLYLLFKLRVYRFFTLVTTHPLLMFSVIFSLFFAFSVGVSISNYGALVRLKIPCVPFFISSLVIMNYILNEEVRLRRGRQKVMVEKGRVLWSG